MKPQAPVRRPLLLVSALVFVILYPAWSILSTYSAANKLANQYNDARRNEIINTAQDIRNFIRNNELKALKERLAADFEMSRFSAVSIINPDGSLLLTIDPVDIISKLPFTHKDHLLYADSYTFFEYETNGYNIRIANQDLDEVAFWNTLKNGKFVILRDIAIVMFMFAFVISYFTRDIAGIILAMRSGNWRSLKNVNSRSEEGATLLKSIETMNSNLTDLEVQNRQLRNQVLPALNSELMSGRKPPYEFECTLVRVDVNNFSHIFSNYPIEDFMNVINGFFEEVTEIVSRYRGYVYEFVGDEVIFYFKDEEHHNSCAMAMAALRDINTAAERLDKRTLKVHGYGFRIKSSASHGKLRFGPQVAGFSLAGAILIETVRILSHISEKENNVIFFDEDFARRISHVVHSQQQKVVTMKGLARTHSLYSYVSHMSLAEALDRVAPEDADLINSFRSDADLIEILDFLRTGAELIDIKLFLSICRRLRNFKVPKPSGPLVQAYQNLLTTLIHKCERERRSEHDLFRLSSSLTIAVHLLDAESFETQLKPYFKSCLAFSDRRVVANSLDVFSHFASLDEDVVFHSLLKSTDNRVVANALVKEGIKGLSRSIVKQISKLLSSKDPLFVASALYVVGELAKFHRAQNPILFETHVGFQSLVHRLRQFVGHSSEMVRRQALIAARKTQDQTTRDAIEAYYIDSADANVKTEIEQFFLKQERGEAETKPPGRGTAAA